MVLIRGTNKYLVERGKFKGTVRKRPRKRTSPLYEIIWKDKWGKTFRAAGGTNKSTIARAKKSIVEQEGIVLYTKRVW